MSASTRRSIAPAGPGGTGALRGRLRLLLVLLLMLLCLELRLDALRLTDLERPAVRADAAEYYFCTINLRHYGVYTRHDSLREGPPRSPDFRRWPGLTLLALPFAGDADRLVPRFLLAQTVASALAGLLVYALAAALAGYRAGVGALLLYAVAPHLINANLYFLTEAPAAVLLLAAAGCLLRALRTARAFWWIGTGVLLGLATLTRPFVELAVPLMLGTLYVSGHPQRGRALKFAGASFLALVLPWHALVWLHGGAGGPGLMVDTLQHGMYPDFMYAGRPETLGLPYNFDPATPRIAGNPGAVLTELAARARAEPLEYLRWYLLGKPLTLWQWAEVQGVREVFIYPPTSTPFDYLPQFRAALAIGHAAHYPAVLAALCGMVLACRRASASWMEHDARVFLQLMAVLFAWTTALHMIGAPFPRYHMPLKPLVFVIAAVTAALLVRRLAGRARAPLT